VARAPAGAADFGGVAGFLVAPTPLRPGAASDDTVGLAAPLAGAALATKAAAPASAAGAAERIEVGASCSTAATGLDCGGVSLRIADAEGARRPLELVLRRPVESGVGGVCAAVVLAAAAVDFAGAGEAGKPVARAALLAAPAGVADRPAEAVAALGCPIAFALLTAAMAKPAAGFEDGACAGAFGATLPTVPAELATATGRPVAGTDT